MPYGLVLTTLLRNQPEAAYYHLHPELRFTLRHPLAGIRHELMTNLSAFISVIEELGTTRALEGMLHAIQDVTTW